MVGVPITSRGASEAGSEASRADEARRASQESRGQEAALLDVNDLSLEDLAHLDDSVVAEIIRDLVQRGRCGTESGERYSHFNAAI